jgi:hypothetical protein
MMFTLRFTLAGNARDKKIIKIGIAINSAAKNKDTWLSAISPDSTFST